MGNTIPTTFLVKKTGTAPVPHTSLYACYFYTTYRP